MTGKLLSQSLARPFGQGGDLLPPSLFWGSQNQTFVNTQISRRFSRNVYKLFPGTCPLLFRGAWRLPGVLPPPCCRQPCPSAWPLQVLSTPCPFPSFLWGTFWSLPLCWSCLHRVLGHVNLDMKLGFYRFLYRRHYCGEKAEEEAKRRVTTNSLCVESPSIIIHHHRCGV